MKMKNFGVFPYCLPSTLFILNTHRARSNLFEQCLQESSKEKITIEHWRLNFDS